MEEVRGHGPDGSVEAHPEPTDSGGGSRSSRLGENWRPKSEVTPTGYCGSRRSGQTADGAEVRAARAGGQDGPSRRSGRTQPHFKNVSGEAHPFHIHVNDFIVTSINGKPYDGRNEQDIVALPPKGVVKIRMKYNRYLGTYVFHCHILAHEDNGMMMIVDVSKDGVVSKATQAKLQAIKDEMATM